jgi:TIR domain
VIAYDTGMSRRSDLEASIRRGYQIVREYEAIEVETDRPEERLRAQRMRDEQWLSLDRQLGEYTELCRKLRVEPGSDLTELAASRNLAGPTSVSRSLPLQLFFSYSHHDEKLRDQLADHLAALEREGLIAGWHDRRIGAGEDWAGAIDHHLSSADLILLLVSPSFVASRYCYELELQRALERHAAGEARVIPVILRPADWGALPFGKLQALPKDGKPVTRWSNRDEAFLDIAQGIRRTARVLTKA